MGEFVKVWEIAGKDPGQHIKVKIEYLSRDIDKVTVAYEVHVKSLGYDPYIFKERHNRLHIHIGNKVVDWHYQLSGDNTEDSTSGTCVVTGVSDGETKLPIHVHNERWFNGAWPEILRTTGIIPYARFGWLEIDANIRCAIQFKGGYDLPEGDNIDRLPNRGNVFYIYKGRNLTIPWEMPVDPRHYYDATGYTLVTLEGDVNTLPPTYNFGQTINVMGDMTFYTAWKAGRFPYYFFPDAHLPGILPRGHSPFPPRDFFQNPVWHEYGTTTDLPNLTQLYMECEPPDFHRPGFEFSGWFYYDRQGNKVDAIDGNGHFACSENRRIDFFPIWKPAAFPVTFDFNYVSGIVQPIVSRDYEYDTAFDFETLLRDSQGGVVAPTTLRPGCVLVGWSPEPQPPGVIYPPGEGAAHCQYLYDAKSKMEWPGPWYPPMYWRPRLWEMPWWPKYYRYGRWWYEHWWLRPFGPILPPWGRRLWWPRHWWPEWFWPRPWLPPRRCLYAVWEHYTMNSICVNGTFKPAEPYIYTNGQWRRTLPYLYTDYKGTKMWIL